MSGPRAFTASRECALIKCFVVRPIATPDKTSDAQADDGNQRARTQQRPITNRKFNRESGNEDQKSDRRKIEPMLGDRGIELDNVRNRKIGSDKPARAEDAKTLSAAVFDPAINKNREQQQP